MAQVNKLNHMDYQRFITYRHWLTDRDIMFTFSVWLADARFCHLDPQKKLFLF